MRTAWAIAARELREKARLFWICAVLALVPFAATLLPGARGSATDVISLVGRFLGTVVGLGIAVTLGASTVVRDLAERRMSFYFTKPVSAPALWIGKAAASLFVSLTCFALIVVPPMFVHGRLGPVPDRQWNLLVALLLVVAFFAAHAVSTIVRSRSPLLVVDFVFLILSVAAVYLIVRPLFLGSALLLVQILLYAIGAAVAVVLAIAPVWQLANGRSDIRRSHAALMRFFWPAVAIVLLLAGGVVAWLVRVPPQDVAMMHIDQAPHGTTLLVTGTAPYRMDYQSTFLVDRATGRFTRIASPPWWGAQFSGDGKVVAWTRPVGTVSLEGLELETPKGPTGIVLPPSASYVLSQDGTRVAVTHGQLLTVYELATGKLLASAAGLEGRSRHQVFFVTPDLVRVIENEQRLGAETPLRVFELDVRARQTRKTAERLLQTARTPVSVSGDGTRMFVRGTNVIADGRTAETIARIDGNASDSAMLYEGRVVLIAHDGGTVHVRTFERDGTPRHDVAIPGVRNVWIAGETEDGKVILAAYGKTMVVLDMATGAIVRKMEGLRGPLPRWSPDPRLIRYGAGEELVGVDDRGALVAWTTRGGVRPVFR